MNPDTGLKGPILESKDEWEIEFKAIHEQLKAKKVLTEEIWQERANPLIPPDGIFEEDIEILQYFGNEKQKESSGKKVDLRQMDTHSFKKARKEVVYKDSDFLTLKILPIKRPDSIGLKKLQKRLKIKKISE